MPDRLVIERIETPDQNRNCCVCGTRVGSIPFSGCIYFRADRPNEEDEIMCINCLLAYGWYEHAVPDTFVRCDEVLNYSVICDAFQDGLTTKYMSRLHFDPTQEPWHESVEKIWQKETKKERRFCLLAYILGSADRIAMLLKLDGRHDQIVTAVGTMEDLRSLILGLRWTLKAGIVRNPNDIACVSNVEYPKEIVPLERSAIRVVAAKEKGQWQPLFTVIDYGNERTRAYATEGIFLGITYLWNPEDIHHISKKSEIVSSVRQKDLSKELQGIFNREQ